MDEDIFLSKAQVGAIKFMFKEKFDDYAYMFIQNGENYRIKRVYLILMIGEL